MKTSAAIRIYQTLRRAHDYPVSGPQKSLCVWAGVFGISFEGAQPTGKAQDAVIHMLADLRAEIDELDRGPHSDELLAVLKPLVAAARAVIDLPQLRQDWNQVESGYLRPHIMMGWQWAALHFPSTDDAVTEETLAELRARIVELETAASGKDVPGELKRFIRRQVELLRMALRRYSVVGIEPLRDALSQSLGDAWRGQQYVAEAFKSAPKASGGVMRKMQDVYRIAVQLCGDADKLKKGSVLMLESILKMVEYGECCVPLIL